MLYIISGTSRTGKTMLAKKISSKKSISYFSLDWLVMGFTNGIPELGIHDLLLPDDIAKRSWNYFKAMFESMLYSEVDYIVEGEAILPELLVTLINKHPKKTRVCFLGYTDIDVNKKVQDIKNFSDAKGDWLNKKSDEYIIDHVNNMIEHSKKIKKSCKKTGLTYFDTSNSFPKVLKKAENYLLGLD
ncbi:MAG: hypothetical protein RLN90_05045 [Balneolaceae bacterium]